MMTSTAMYTGVGLDLTQATVEVLDSPQGSKFRYSPSLWDWGGNATEIAEIGLRQLSGGIAALDQPVVRHSPIPTYGGATAFDLFSRGARASDAYTYVVHVKGGTGGGVDPLSTRALPYVLPGTYRVLWYPDEAMGGGLGLSQDLPGWGHPPVPELLAESKYVQDAVEEFRRLNGPALRANPRIFGFVVEILNLSVRQGYRPVATIDETDNSLEIEARLDPNRLLLLQVWPSGATEGLIFSDREGFKSLEPTTVSGVVDWLVSSEHVEKPGHPFRR